MVKNLCRILQPQTKDMFFNTNNGQSGMLKMEGRIVPDSLYILGNDFGVHIGNFERVPNEIGLPVE